MSTVMIIGLVCAVLFVFFLIGCLCNWMENKTEDDSEELPEWWTKDNPPVDNEEIKKEINKSVNDLETRNTKAKVSKPIKKTPAKKVASSGNARQNRDDAFHDNLLLNASLMDTMDSPSSSSCSPSSSSSSSSSDSSSSFSSSSSSFSSSDSGGGGCF